MGGGNAPRTRNAFFTWNNPSDAQAIITSLQEWKIVTYGVVGEEVGEACGTPHLQGYLEFSNQVAWSVVKKTLDCHCVARKATPEHAASYCKKGSQPKSEWKEEGVDGPNFGMDAKVTEWGTITQQGKRNDLTPACDAIKEGVPMRQVAQDHPELFVKYHKGLIALQSILIQPRDEVPEVIVYHGGTGVGKSRIAREQLDAVRYVWHPQQAQWFDGYAGEKHVLFEEFRGQIPFGMLLSLLDRYDCKIQYKGRMCEFAGTKIILTSPLHPTQWYKQDELAAHDKVDQLLRRITKIVDLDEQQAKRRRLEEDNIAKMKIVHPNLTFI